MSISNLPTLAEIEAERRGKPFDKAPRKTAQARVEGRRDSKGWRTAAKVNKHGEPTKAAERAAARKHENEVKAETRRKVWLRSAVCEACEDTEDQTAAKWWKREHEAHEVVPRSLTRGMAPEIRFSTENTARLCCECHAKFHRKTLAFQFLTDLRMDGSYITEDKSR